LELGYEKKGSLGEVHRTVEPLGIIFSEFYFYLIAHLHQKGKEYPAIYRIDRIRSFKVTEKRFTVREQDRFQEGQFRKKIQFMQSGELIKVIFRFSGPSIEAVVDRLPNAHIIQDGEQYLVETEVFGRGIKMWLLSQGQYIEVLKPTHFREEMIRTIDEMRMKYSKG
jgi:predicted DNA-binding transcriptional regulator YafY